MNVWLYILNLIDIISNNPGFCDQKFLPTQLEKIRNIVNISKERNSNFDIVLDGIALTLL